MKGLRPLLLLMALGASGCGVLDIRDSVREEYEKNRERWESVGPNSYVITMSRLCFCGPEAKGPVDVTVQNNAVVSRVYSNSGEAVPSQYASVFPTVDGLFDIIKDALDDGYDDLEVFYDPLAGVPFNFWIDYDENTADEEVGYVVDLPLERIGS